jgi:D-serine deaminase-like pyridoxal phosphate-dependent protein
VPDSLDRIAVAERLGRAPRPSTATPYLLVDGMACLENIRVGAEFFASTPVTLRPHFKAHKCVDLLRRQVAAGECSGVTCATGWEAGVLAKAGFDNILVANQVVDPLELQALWAAAGTCRVTVAIDSSAHVRLLDESAPDTGTSLGILIELDVGLHRSGLPPEDGDVVGLARAVGDSRRLFFEGLLGYEGHAALEPDLDTRRSQVALAANLLRAARDELERDGIDVPVVSGGSTGTFELATDEGIWTEIEAGSYVLMDATYAQLGLPFDIALYCVATLISRNGHRGVLNVGLKQLSVEYGLPVAFDPSIEILGLSDEHARIAIDSDNPIEVGDVVLVVPSHVDPSINLHDSLAVWQEDERLESWSIARTTRRL